MKSVLNIEIQKRIVANVLKEIKDRSFKQEQWLKQAYFDANIEHHMEEAISKHREEVKGVMNIVDQITLMLFGALDSGLDVKQLLRDLIQTRLLAINARQETHVDILRRFTDETMKYVK